MRLKRGLRMLGVCLAIFPWLSVAQPTILGLSPEGDLSRLDGVNDGIAVIEWTPNPGQRAWHPVQADLATNTMRTLRLPPTALRDGLYRLAIWQTPPDPSLILHLPFNDNFSSGLLLDASGYGHHAPRYSATRWPAAVEGVDGAQAGRFRVYYDGYGPNGNSGDYLAIRRTPALAHLTQATFSVWAHHYASPSGSYTDDNSATFLNAGLSARGAWSFGRHYRNHTSFNVYTDNSTMLRVVSFGDFTANGDTGGWNHYAVTFNGSTFRGYFNGVEIGGSEVPGFDGLRVVSEYLGVSCWMFNIPPQFNDTSFPTAGFMNGAMDDIRIYNRVLDAPEIMALHRANDYRAPSVPANLSATAQASTQVELAWSRSTDNFGIAGYTLYRGGTPIADLTGARFTDRGARPGAANVYTVSAYDRSGNHSAPSAPATAVTGPAGSPVQVIVDNGYGAPYVEAAGNWPASVSWPGYYGSGFVTDDNTGKGLKSFAFRPVVPETGTYDVQIWYVERSHLATNVPVDILHAGGISTVAVNQRNGGGSWQSLGSHVLQAGTNAIIRIRTDGTSGPVVADAVRISK